MFGRMPELPTDIIMGVPQASLPVTAQQYAIQTVQRLQLAYELARQKLQKRQQAAEQFNLGKRFLEFDNGDVVLIYHPHDTQHEDSNKLLGPWRGPYVVRSRLSPVVFYRVSLEGSLTEISVHLGRMEKYIPRSISHEADFPEINDTFLGKSYLSLIFYVKLRVCG